jgi:hypothetical protein
VITRVADYSKCFDPWTDALVREGDVIAPFEELFPDEANRIRSVMEMRSGHWRLYYLTGLVPAAVLKFLQQEN